MRIQLNRSYTGPHISDLPAGEYDEADERLHGRAAYLVGIEVAVWLDAPESPEPSQTDSAEAPQAVKPVASKKGRGK